MKHRATIAWSSALIVLAIVAFYLGQNNSFATLQTVAVGTSGKLKASRLDDIESTLNLIHNKIDDLTRTFKTHTHTISAGMKFSSNLGEEGENSFNNNEFNNLEKKSGMNFEQAIAFQKQRDEFISNAFDSEVIDEMWSNEVIANVGEMFLKPELQAAQISNIDCRTTLCRAELVTPKMSNADRALFETHMLIELTQVFKGGVKFQEERAADGQVTMVGYLTREGHRLPRLGPDQGKK